MATPLDKLVLRPFDLVGDSIGRNAPAATDVVACPVHFSFSGEENNKPLLRTVKTWLFSNVLQPLPSKVLEDLKDSSKCVSTHKSCIFFRAPVYDQNVPDDVKVLQHANIYGAVVREFLSYHLKAKCLRLQPITGETRDEHLSRKLPTLNMEALQNAFSALDRVEQTRLLDGDQCCELCVSDDARVDVYGSARQTVRAKSSSANIACRPPVSAPMSAASALASLVTSPITSAAGPGVVVCPYGVLGTAARDKQPGIDTIFMCPCYVIAGQAPSPSMQVGASKAICQDLGIAGYDRFDTAVERAIMGEGAQLDRSGRCIFVGLSAHGPSDLNILRVVTHAYTVVLQQFLSNDASRGRTCLRLVPLAGGGKGRRADPKLVAEALFKGLEDVPLRPGMKVEMCIFEPSEFVQYQEAFGGNPAQLGVAPQNSFAPTAARKELPQELQPPTRQEHLQQQQQQQSAMGILITPRARQEQLRQQSQQPALGRMISAPVPSSSGLVHGARRRLAVDISKLSVKDPRTGTPAPLVAFYHPGHDEPWDALCGAGFLGNFFSMGRDALVVGPLDPNAPAQPFENAEAAFQALKFWRSASSFRRVLGKEAFDLKNTMLGQEDWTYAGHGSNWAGMLAVLRAKFAADSEYAFALQRTDQAFLLEHNNTEGRDKVWSDNLKGDGKNWLGMQLMILRDDLNARTGTARSNQQTWTRWIVGYCGIDLQTGGCQTQAGWSAWQAVVGEAAAAVRDKCPVAGAPAGAETCARPGCSRPTWNGKAGEFCGRYCQQQVQGQGHKGGNAAVRISGSAPVPARTSPALNAGIAAAARPRDRPSSSSSVGAVVRRPSRDRYAASAGASIRRSPHDAAPQCAKAGCCREVVISRGGIYCAFCKA